MNYWLVKSDPDAYSWNDFLKDKWTFWDGVRNYQARNNLKSMKNEDLVLFYHSIDGKEIMGIAKVIKEFYKDPTTEDERWVAVDLEHYQTFNKPVTLDQIKETKSLENIALVKQSRLSVMPLKVAEFDAVVEMGN